MSGLYNQFDLNNFLPSAYVVEALPLCSIQENQVRSERVGDQDARIYSVYNQSKDRITQQTNLVDKIARFVKDDEEKEEDPEQSVEVQTRYFNLDSIDVLSKGVCRRCKKPGHFEKWCVEDIAESKVTCRFCLGDHYFLKCPNSLCFKCNQAGHMAKDCDVEGIKCHRCNKKGHKSKDCNVIILDDENVFEKDKQRLKDLLCLNCQERGHLNCFSKGYKKYDLLYCEGKEQREREKMNRTDHSSKDKHNNQHHNNQDHHQHHHHHHQHNNQHHRQHDNHHNHQQHNHQHDNHHYQNNQHSYKQKHLKEQTQNLPHKVNKTIQKQKYHQQDSSSQYSMWSEESPNTKRMNNNKQRKNKIKQKKHFKQFN
ncbi:unnamed protein product [Paramecium octaurelia]|uniref:CCHC-type domain-containing protein n=1 Tax=Paramecium octaurelia TaxID=43137 RepID=A0A8S1UIA4_PAROT|nr:unnamed protein product [Paramecium octaurelia]